MVRNMVGLIIFIFAVPIGLIGLAVIILSIRPHPPARPCLERRQVEVTLFEGVYFDLKFPWASLCDKRY